jgi:hypothetical protein
MRRSGLLISDNVFLLHGVGLGPWVEDSVERSAAKRKQMSARLPGRRCSLMGSRPRSAEGGKIIYYRWMAAARPTLLHAAGVARRYLHLSGTWRGDVEGARLIGGRHAIGCQCGQQDGGWAFDIHLPDAGERALATVAGPLACARNPVHPPVVPVPRLSPCKRHAEGARLLAGPR